MGGAGGAGWDRTVPTPASRVPKLNPIPSNPIPGMDRRAEVGLTIGVRGLDALSEGVGDIPAV